MDSPTSTHSLPMSSPTTTGPYLSSLDAHTAAAQLARENQELRQQLNQARHQNQVLVHRYNQLAGAPLHGEGFRQERERRARARVTQLCSPNRNGISSCAWHASRHQTKEHAPRQAPAGYLNCGCSIHEVLFEETLARNGIGALQAGAERMSPPLRRMLLHVLQQNYRYTDGDFEIDRTTGYWKQNEDPLSWEERMREKQGKRTA